MVNSKTASAATKVNSHERQLILHARHHDPFSFLGQHPYHDNGNQLYVYRVFLPNTSEVFVKQADIWIQLEKTHRDGLFELFSESKLTTPCLLNIKSGSTAIKLMTLTALAQASRKMSCICLVKAA